MRGGFHPCMMRGVFPPRISNSGCDCGMSQNGTRLSFYSVLPCQERFVPREPAARCDRCSNGSPRPGGMTGAHSDYTPFLSVLVFRHGPKRCGKGWFTTRHLCQSLLTADATLRASAALLPALVSSLPPVVLSSPGTTGSSAPLYSAILPSRSSIFALV